MSEKQRVGIVLLFATVLLGQLTTASGKVNLCIAVSMFIFLILGGALLLDLIR